MPLSETILLATLNARHVHASLGLRCLLANMGELRAQTLLREFTIAQRPADIVERMLADSPRIVGLGVYIWNVAQTTQVVRLLKAVRPELKVVLGGPEVSHEQDSQEICALADHVITGWGDVSFPALCRGLLAGPRPLMKLIAGEQPALEQLALPYGEYSSRDLAERLTYVEASRGCPFKCEFCLSSLDRTAWAFDLDRFLAAMEDLLARGARQFKFVDRTFNLKVENSARILQFFLDRLVPDLFLHFELVPDALPERLKALILRFPPGVLQFEVGIQTFEPQVQQRIARRQDHDRTVANLGWLVNHATVHVHADLIVGLPGENLQSFARGFDALHALAPHEIQVGILKRLRGAPIARHTEAFRMVHDPHAPYALLQSADLSFSELQRMQRFARYWDLVANSGRFHAGLALLLAPGSAFANFMAWSDWLWQRSGKTHQFSAEQLVDALFDHLTQARGLEAALVREALERDYRASGARGKPTCLAAGAAGRGPLSKAGRAGRSLTVRRMRHAASMVSHETEV